MSRIDTEVPLFWKNVLSLRNTFIDEGVDSCHNAGLDYMEAQEIAVTEILTFCIPMDSPFWLDTINFRGLPVGFLLLRYSVLFTVESLSLLYLLVIS